MMPGTGKFKIKRKEKNFLGDKKKKNKTELCFDPFDHIIACDLYGTHQANNDSSKSKLLRLLMFSSRQALLPCNVKFSQLSFCQ